MPNGSLRPAPRGRQTPRMRRRITLYHFERCPYCRTVRTFMDQHGIDIPQKDILTDPDAYQELLATGGRAQVPCLLVDGQALYESEEIIRWLQNQREGRPRAGTHSRAH